MTKNPETSRYITTELLASLGAEHAAPPQALTPPPENMNVPVLRLALEQVNKRLDGQLATKTATEARAVALVGYCTTVLTAVAGASLIELTTERPRPVLLAAGVVAVVCLFIAITFAFSAIKPRSVTLPGRLPSDIWEDVIDEQQNEVHFIAYLLGSLQRPMVKNEELQTDRARSLRRALTIAMATVPLSLIASLCAIALEHGWLLPSFAWVRSTIGSL